MLKWITHRLSLRQQLAALVYLTVCTLMLLNIFYYFSFNRLTTQRAEEYFTTIFDLLESRISEVANNFEATAQSIGYNQTLQRYLTANDTEDQSSVKPFVENLFMEAILSNPRGGEHNTIEGIYLEGPNDITAIKKPGIDVILHKICSDYRLGTFSYFTPLYTRAYIDPETQTIYYGYIQPIKRLANSGVDILSGLGYCVYVCNAGTIQDLMLDIHLPTNAMVLLYDYDNQILASTNTGYSGYFLPSVLQMDISLTQLSREMKPVHINSISYLSKLEKISGAEWRMLLLIPTKDLISDMNPIRTVGIILGLISGALGLTLGALIVRAITRQVDSLITGMQYVDSYGANYRLSTKFSNEISVLAVHINRMLGRVEESVQEALETREKLFANELAKKHAEMFALQSQIYPHFLYNTLECIRSIALYRGVNEISRIATSMGNIFRYCVSPEDYVTLADEIDCVNEYFEIISIRFEGRMTLKKEIPERFMKKRILKMILQPVVENAMYHGLERVSRPGMLRISCAEEGDRFVLTIEDNGNGMDSGQFRLISQRLKQEYTLNQSAKHLSIGLLNIQSRLKITYGDPYGIELSSAEGVGTTVRLIMPADLEALPDGKEGEEKINQTAFDKLQLKVEE